MRLFALATAVALIGTPVVAQTAPTTEHVTTTTKTTHVHATTHPGRHHATVRRHHHTMRCGCPPKHYKVHRHTSVAKTTVKTK